MTEKFSKGDDGCGGNFTGTSGIISSPNYPDLYPVNLTCLWLITVDGDGMIELTLQTFHLETDFDFLRVRVI